MNATFLAIPALMLALAMPVAGQGVAPPAGNPGGTTASSAGGSGTTSSYQPPTVTVSIVDTTAGTTESMPDLVSALVRTTTSMGTMPAASEVVLVKLGDDTGLAAALNAAIAAGDSVYVDLLYTLPDGTTQELQANGVTSAAVHLSGSDDWDDGLLDDFQQETLKLAFTALTRPGHGVASQ
jgi:hypothetical protein